MAFSTLILAAGTDAQMKSRRATAAHTLLGKPLIRWVVDAAWAAGSERIFVTLDPNGRGYEQLASLVQDTTIIACADTTGASGAAGASGATPEADEASAAPSAATSAAPEASEATSATAIEAAIEAARAELEKAGGASELVVLHGTAALLTPQEIATFAAPQQQQGSVGPGPQRIETRAQLAQATKAMQRRINQAHLEAGVSMLDPDLVWIGPDVSLENDTELLPLTMLWGTTSIGAGSTVGPNTRISDSVIGSDCCVEESILDRVTLEDGVQVGPRAYLRPGTLMKRGSKAGTHVEIKNSTIGPGSKVPHLSYLGDATLGSEVNIGAGSITCNYDGSAKNPTEIGDQAFVGSDTMLVAPVRVGAHAVIGAGSVITRDVPDGALAIERTKQIVKEHWAEQHSRASLKQQAKKAKGVLRGALKTHSEDAPPENAPPTASKEAAAPTAPTAPAAPEAAAPDNAPEEQSKGRPQ
ncbi:MAG: bifunctional UDP-N-acetylglucosamine diphosphorylase/glucosamine-1-phosphate N-acetyltransferase GlmU [Coriobacteriales bacterium]|jgi:bifunctional UDP-N-acetylglucosamine pyrophosphorylase/glucosamine-1-phosphate N-acetyltransferase|nr:bifunctional UDP-N-acetylglucosamine diphosphorylase/glucosamine-1-phosphate N-acetyltransferase GlmU [Coriobacteriales bacterium]